MKRVAYSLLILSTTQAVPVTTLTTPSAELEEGFTALDAVRELGDGRVLTIERCEQTVKLIDFGAGTAVQVGRTGSGPGEYRNTSRLLALGGDTSAIHDPGNGRFLIILPDGKPGETFALPPRPARVGSGPVAAVGFSPSLSDAQGRLYAREFGLIDAGPTLMRAESVAVERWDRRGARRDTIAFHRTPRPGPVQLGAPDVPFLTGIQWAVAPDGRVALVDPSDYHLEFIGPGRTRTVGRPIPFQPVRVTDALKQQWKEDRKSPCGQRSISMPGPGGRSVTVEMRAGPEPTEWPDVLPPFLTGAALFAPDGLLWVKRTTAAGLPATYDVLDQKGTVIRRVMLPPRTRLLGFGRSGVYAVRIDQDDLQHLQRYSMPR
jgi:hypothetical protein